MCNVASKADLPPAGGWLVELMQGINFGCILDLAVRGGKPVLDPPPRVVRKLKMGGENSPRPEARSADFALKREVLELFEHLERLGNGVVRCIEIRHGLPVQAEIEEPNQA